MNAFIEIVESFLEWGGTKKEAAALAVSGLALVAELLFPCVLPFNAAWVAVVLCGVPILLEAAIGLAVRFDVKADVLVALALVAAVFIGEYFAAGEVAFIMKLGELLEALTVARARAGIEDLARLSPQTARILEPDGSERIVPVEQVEVGDRLRLLPTEAVPVDGVITSGQTSINQAILTGESMPIDKTVGDKVFSGTINQFGVFEMDALRVGTDSSIQRLVRLVESADAGKTKIVSIADRWATWIVLGSLAAAIVTWFATGEIIRSVTVLVVFCPCALVLATPTAIMAAIGAAARKGFLVRQGDALERLAGTVRVAFDKTGTLTSGQPSVAAAVSVDSSGAISDRRLYELAASAERFSEHPLGKAIVRCFGEKFGPARELSAAENFRMIPGQGVCATVDGQEVLAGNERLFTERGIELPDAAVQAADAYRNDGSTIVYVTVNRVPVGFLALSDTPRAGAAQTIDQLAALGVESTLITGDHANAAQAIARRLHIGTVCANSLPEDKLRRIDDYQRAGQPVCMVGDGINDAPALKKSFVGIAMGGIGSDIAIDAADIALIDDDIRNLPRLFALARRMMTTIRGNIAFSMVLNFLAVFLAMAGLLNPLTGALVHNAGSVLVLVNSALLLRNR